MLQKKKEHTATPRAGALLALPLLFLLLPSASCVVLHFSQSADSQGPLLISTAAALYANERQGCTFNWRRSGSMEGLKARLLSHLQSERRTAAQQRGRNSTEGKSSWFRTPTDKLQSD